MPQIRFSEQHLAAFERISHDRNPLHRDPQYAERTPYGKPVVYGMGVVLSALGQWAQGRSFRLKYLRAHFYKPHFTNEDYELRISENQDGVCAELYKGESCFSYLEFQCSPSQTDILSPRSVSEFSPLLEARHETDIESAISRLERSHFHYEADSQGFARVSELFHLKPGQIPWDQLQVLLASSYFIGMELPGTQALFTGAEFQFSESTSHEGHFEVREWKFKSDLRTHQIKIMGSATGVDSFMWNALVRPERVRHQLEAIHAEVGHSNDFVGKTAFISGGSRGFGAVLGQAVALQGADIVFTYRADKEEAQRVATSIRDCGRKASFFKSDLSETKDAVHLRDTLSSENFRIDFLFHNAMPSIPNRPFASQASDEFLNFTQSAIAIFVNTTYAVLPLMQPSGKIISISTIYMNRPEPGFSHYLTVKSALEGFTRGLACEYPHLGFLNVRPPKMRTDQTNQPVTLQSLRSAPSMAAKLIQRLRELPTGRNLFEINLE